MVMKTTQLLLLTWFRPYFIKLLYWLKHKWLELSATRWRREMIRAQSALERRIERLQKSSKNDQ